MKWTCDECGHQIENVEDGWVEWKKYRNENKQSDGLRLVHHRHINCSCAYNEHDIYQQEEPTLLADSDLNSFLGDDGLMRLLSMIADDEVNKSDVLEMIKRLHIKGYEASRLHFQEAIREGIFEPNTPPNYYVQSNIEATLNYLKEKNS